MLILLAAVIVAAATAGYVRFMGFEDISYEVSQCDQPLTEDSTWADVQTAGCSPADASTAEVELFHEGSYYVPDQVSGSTYTFEGWPVNSPSHSIGVQTSDSARSIVVVDPTNEQIRDELSGDAPGTGWTGFIGSRGPTTYWILITY